MKRNQWTAALFAVLLFCAGGVVGALAHRYYAATVVNAGAESFRERYISEMQRKLTLTDLADRIGITIANLSILKTNKARAIRFSTLDALCRELQCQPGELLEWTPDEVEDGKAEV